SMILYRFRIIVLMIIIAPLFFIGIGAKYPWVLFGTHGIAIGMIVFFTITLLFILSVCFFKLEKLSFTLIFRAFIFNFVLSILFAIAYDFIQYKHFLKFGYQNPKLLYILCCMFLLSMPIFYKKIQRRHLFILVGIFVVLHELLSIYYFPNVIARSDMLAAIALSLKAFIHFGDPYTQLAVNIGIPPYLPVTILSFIPAVFLNIDFRIMSLLLIIVLLFLLYYKFNKLNNISQLALILALCNPMWLMRHELYFQFFLIELVVIFLYFEHINEMWRSIILGVFIATLQFAWVMFPFIVLAYNKSYYSIIRQLFVSLIVGILIILSFIHGYFTSFINAALHHFNYAKEYNSDIMFALSPIFHFATNQKPLYLIQVFGCFIILGLAIYKYINKKIRQTDYYLSYACICYLWFIITNYFLESYFLIPPLLIFTLITQKITRTNKPC
ncbi:MAG: hypothetical protein K2P99_06005, partial [Burkholderiales bacterium]|nr:hypothetical protein [Burkholderiales bacterium]